MNDAAASAKPARRALNADAFADFESVIADVDRLRSGGYARAGAWTLPMICQHLASIVEYSMSKPAADDAAPTPEQARAKGTFFEMVLNGMPPNTPAPEPFQPSADADDGEVDRFIAALRAFDRTTHAAFEFSPKFGPIATYELHGLHRAHAAHHLSFLVPDVASGGEVRNG